MCVIWTTLAFASRCFSSLFDYKPVTKAANSKQKASSERNALKARLSALPADDCNYLNKFTQLFACCGWFDQSSALSAAYLIHPQMKGLLLSSVPTASLRRPVVTDSINNQK